MQGGGGRTSGASRRRPDTSNKIQKGEENLAFKIVSGEENKHSSIIYTPAPQGFSIKKIFFYELDLQKTTAFFRST